MAKKYRRNNKNKRVLKGIGLVVATGALTLCGVHLFNNLTGKMSYKKLLEVEIDKDFFKGCEETTSEVSSVSYSTLTYEVKDTDYKIEICDAVVSSKSFKDTQTFHEGSDYIKVYNLEGSLIKFKGLNAKEEEIEKVCVLTYVEETKNSYSHVEITAGEFTDFDSINSIVIYG